MATTAAQPSLSQINAQARAAVLARSLDRMQIIYSQTIATPGTANNVIQIAPQNVGLVKGFLVEISGTVTNTGAATPANDATLTDFGVANVLSQVIFNDLQNYTRIQTAGWHLALMDSVKRRRPFGAALALAANGGILPAEAAFPLGYGDNWNVITAPTVLAGAAGGPGVSSGPFRMMYWVPLSYADNDLRGAVYMNVVNATAQLQLTLNPAPSVAGVAATGTDTTLAMYSGVAAPVTFSNVTVTVFQSYLDQLPMGKNGPILPPLDLSTIYELKNTQLIGMVQATDFPIPYPNFRDFMSTFVIFDNVGGTPVGAGPTRSFGTDLNYWTLQSANLTNLWKVPPEVVALKSRNHIGMDFPAGTYYFDSRNRPISTVQYGNLNLIMNPSVVCNPGAVALIGFEDLGLVNTLTGAGSLPGS